MKQKQQGYFLVIAVIFIMVIGVMGSVIAYMLAGRAMVGPAEYGGMRAFYLAESGLEVASRLLVGTGVSSPLTCATLTGAPAVTNASLLGGTFTATAVNNALYSASTTSTGGITASSTSLPLTSVAGFAPHGRVRIDSEAIEYAAISGSTLVGLTRGAGGTTAASHSSGATVSESICLVSVSAGIPSIASPTYQRTIEMAVEMLSSTSDVWVVGARSGNNFSIIRWNTPTASAWNNYSFTDSTNREALNGVSVAYDNTGWAVGTTRSNNYTFVRWNGSAWSAAPLAGPCSGATITLYGVSSMSNAEAWAVGARYRNTCSGSTYSYNILKWNGSAWTPLTNLTSPAVPAAASSNQDLRAISMLDTNNDGAADIGFAVGNGGTILEYDGTNWTTDPQSKIVTTRNLLGVQVVSASEAWAVGASGAIIKWNGSTWSVVTSPTTTQLNAVRMLDTDADGLANVGWAVGSSGRIIDYNGSTWALETSGTSTNLFGVGVNSATTSTAVGASGLIRYWNGTSWATQSSPISVQFNAINVATLGVVSTGSYVGSWQQTFR